MGYFLKDFVRRQDGSWAVVYTNYVEMNGRYESMAFPCNQEGKVIGSIFDDRLRYRLYKGEADARKGHEAIINELRAA